MGGGGHALSCCPPCSLPHGVWKAVSWPCRGTHTAAHQHSFTETKRGARGGGGARGLGANKARGGGGGAGEQYTPNATPSTREPLRRAGVRHKATKQHTQFGGGMTPSGPALLKYDG